MCPLNPEPWPSPCLPRAPASSLGRCRALWDPLSLYKRVKDTALTLPAQPMKERLPWPGPSPLTSLPGGPSPQISLLPAERLVRRGTTPSQLKVLEPIAGLATAQKAWVPSHPPELPGCAPPPLPSGRAGGAKRSVFPTPQSRSQARTRGRFPGGDQQEIGRAPGQRLPSQSSWRPLLPSSPRSPWGGLGRGRRVLGTTLPPPRGGWGGSGAAAEEGPWPSSR